MRDANLRTAENVSGGMERHIDRADAANITVTERVYRGLRSKSCAEQWQTFSRREIGVIPRMRVIAMRVRDQRAGHGQPRIDVEIACWAIETCVGERQCVVHRRFDTIKRSSRIQSNAGPGSVLRPGAMSL